MIRAIKKSASKIIPLSPSKGNLENRIIPLNENMQKEIDKVLNNAEETFAERIGYFRKRESEYRCMEDDPRSKNLLRAVQKAIRKLEKEQREQTVSMYEYFHDRDAKMRNQRQICIDYALLDGKPEIHLSDEGVTESVGELFYLSLLKKFEFCNSSIEITQVIKVLEGMFRLLHLKEKNVETSDPAHHYSTEMWSLLRQLKNRELPYLFVPISSSEHALAGKIEWNHEQEFVFSVINPGEGALFQKNDVASDIVYPYLEAKDVVDIGLMTMSEVKTAPQFYVQLDKLLSQTKRKRCRLQGRTHQMQRGSSCSLQSISKLIHGVLPDSIYWRFKAFATMQAIQELPPGARLEFAESLYFKRYEKIDR